MLKLRNIKKSYKTGDFVQDVLDDVNINFRKNEFVSILGPSGSGKTTLLNIIGGLDSYDYGDLIINGISTKKFKDRDFDYYRNACVGFVFQDYNLIGHLSILDNVLMNVILSGNKRKLRKKLALDALKKVGLLDQAYKKPSELSGGQRQRVAIARALVNDPDIILADEPTGALDSNTSEKIMELIKEISKDKLVIMVTHNKSLALKYSDRIIELKDGKIVSDSKPLFNYFKEKNNFKIGRTSMGFLSAIKLSLNNILTKKGRAFLTAFASSIGIIGIALILSISNGFNKEVNSYEAKTMVSFPISIKNEVSTIDFDNEKKQDDKTNSNEKFLYPYASQKIKNTHVNNINSNYINYINKIDKSLVNTISYYHITNFNLLSSNEKDVKQIDSRNINFSELPDDFGVNNYLKDNYDLLYGSLPKNYDEVVLIVDDKNRVDSNLLDALYLNKDKKKISFKDILGKKLKLVKNDDFYLEVGNNSFVKKDINMELYNNVNNENIKIVGIIRKKEDARLLETEDSNIVSKIGYTKSLIKKVVNDNKNSKVVEAQKLQNHMVTMGNISFEEYGITKNEALTMLGSDDTPFMINIYPKDFNAKEKIKKYLDSYNENKDMKDKIIYTDYAKEITSLTSNIINGITIVLIAFSSISLLVSSIMIGIITYISVLERTKEIGILRSIGASKKDIARVFNTENIIVGFISGITGILITRILLIFVNKILYNLTEIKSIGMLKINHAIILIVISILLTLIGGFIPSKAASKKDPVKALRSE